MPQGGIDPGEDPWPAALRELHEETNIRSVKKLAEVPDWLDYDLPPDVAQARRKARPDRMESKVSAKFESIRAGFAIEARRRPDTAGSRA